LPSAVSGDYVGVHQARVASRRLREAVPVLATGLRGSKAGKARKKIRRLTKALGTVRELDVTLAVLDELARNESVPRSAVEAVRARVIAERDRGRESMLKRLDRVNVDKLHRRLGSVAEALEVATEEGWRESLAARLVKRSQRLATAIDPVRFGVKSVYLFGSTKNGTAGPASDIDLLLHVEDEDARRRDLAAWLEGWSLSLAEANYVRTGYRSDGLLDVHYVTDADIERGGSFASKIGAVTDAARPLQMGVADGPAETT